MATAPFMFCWLRRSNYDDLDNRKSNAEARGANAGNTTMDFELSEELRMLQETVRRFVDRESIPIEMETMDGPDLKPDVRAQLEGRARELGLWLLDTPEEYGGQGLKLLGMAVVWEELARTIALPPRGPSILGPEAKPLLESAQR